MCCSRIFKYAVQHIFFSFNQAFYIPFWSLDNLGFGNLALQKQIQAQVKMATAELHRELDRIRTEVSEAYALSASRRQQVDISRLRIETAERAFRQDLNRSKNLEGRPIEVLNSANNLATELDREFSQLSPDDRNERG